MAAAVPAQLAVAYDPGCEDFWMAEYTRLIGRKYSKRGFRAYFGVSPSACTAVWKQLLAASATPRAEIHLLCALHFLAEYDTTEVASAMFHMSPQLYKEAVDVVLTEIVKHVNIVLSISPTIATRFVSPTRFSHL
jgi:hypothetical protein